MDRLNDRWINPFCNCFKAFSLQYFCFYFIGSRCYFYRKSDLKASDEVLVSVTNECRARIYLYNYHTGTQYLSHIFHIVLKNSGGDDRHNDNLFS